MAKGYYYYSMDRFAQELIDHIICYCTGKRQTAAGIYYLFSRVWLHLDSLGPLVDLVESSSHRILSFVQHLKLRYDDTPLDTTHLARLHQCPNLERIDVDIISESWAFDDAADWLGSEALHAHLRSWSANSGSISRLTLEPEEPMFVPWRAFADVISCLPSIEIPEVWNLGPLSAPDADPALFPPGKLACVELHLDYKLAPAFFAYLSLHGLPTFVSLKLHIALHDRADWSPIRESRAATRFQQRIFRHTPMLQHLTFDASSSSDFLHTLSLLPAMASLISITLWTVELNKDFACPALDAELAGPRFRPLQ
ncbi:hypothetical protein DFH09DRAFT_1332916 [Mycena vulgaris]|nr:hypothetical protein DFH09DRAFT_1332916 [Mycena vulgaris]